MRQYFWIVVIALFISGIVPSFSEASPWGASYFPNVPLTDQDGKTAYFFEDLIKDKVVVINFIYTTCPDTCPLETAKLVRVQNILGDRLGDDVFFYSITIDPEKDTPEVLKAYKEGFKAKWNFYTGKESDIIQLRRKLGLYIEEIPDDSNNHNVNMIIGNQKTGRWMKRSPFENAHLLADQIGNWLTGWKKAPKGDSYANAPELRNISRGEQIFRTRCASCHSMTGKERKGALGPDLLGVNQRREQRWLYDWLKAPDQMLAKKDPIAMAMYKQYNNMAMPNFRLNKKEADELLEYIAEETRRVWGSDATLRTVEDQPSVYDQQIGDNVVAITNSWIRESHDAATVNAGYMTLVNVGNEAVKLVKVESDAYSSVEVHEMVPVDGFMKMRQVTDMEIPAKGQIQLVPGGKHLMLMGPKQHLKSGQEVEITLIFKSGNKQKVSVKVAAR